MHRGRTWTQRQLIGLGTPEDYNERAARDAGAGRHGACRCMPCNSVFRGYDMDESPIELLGTCGTVVNTAEHMDRALAGRRPRRRTSCAMNDPSPFTLLAFMLAAARRRGTDWRSITGTSNQSDYLCHYVANHMFFRIALPGARRILVDHIEFCNQHVPHWNPMSVVGQHMQQAGATPAEAMAFTLGTAIQYARGLHRARHGPRRLPAALHLLLRHLDQLLRGGRQVPRRAPHLGAARAASASARRIRARGASSSTARPRAST